MKTWQKFFKGKKITQMGLGLLGRGVGDAAFLAECGVNLLVTDLKDKKELALSLGKLRKYKNIKFVLGKHRLEDFRNRDFILKAAGVPLDSPFIAEARKNKIPIEMDASLFFKLMPSGMTFIGITGTRGKTTTAYLIYEILKRLNLKDKKGSTFLAGNIKDTATLPLLEKVREGDFVVAELDSWQLQGFGDSRISPHISVFTTFLLDHLNYYGNSMEKYFTDKANIFKYQKRGDTLILGEQITKLNLVEKKGSTFEKAIIARADDIPTNWKLKIPGEHNRANAACALAVARALRIPDGISKKAIENFGGIPGRLEFIREINGVKIYNDTCATTPDATIAALRALNKSPFEKGGGLISIGTEDLKIPRVILIMGGSDKGLDMSELIKEIPKFCKVVFLLPGSGSEKLPARHRYARALAGGQAKFVKVENLKEAVKKARAIAKKGDVILFSPAFASFGMFKNEYDRGEQFVKLVKNYEKIDFKKIKRPHFIGIGGIGVSAIAQMILEEGKQITGSDLVESELTKGLRERGAKISIGQKISDIPKNADLIIYSTAIEVAAPKFFKAVKWLATPSISYAEALSLISADKFTIAISGTHGKTTTTGMVAKILMDADLDPTVVIGSILKETNSNFIAGKSKYFVVEVDEYQRKFLTISPRILVVNNIDVDHLDYFKNLADIQSAFAEFAARVPKDGAIVTDFAHPNIAPIMRAARAIAVDYNSAPIDNLELKFPGEHNRQNARAALTVAGILGIDFKKAVLSLNNFSGTWRRFEYKGKTKNRALVYDDYAHNPQKVEALLLGAREKYPRKRIIAVFQPHLYSRTKTLLKPLSKSFAVADLVVLAPIFPAREAPDPTISSEILLRKIRENYKDKILRHIARFEDIADFLNKEGGAGDVILTIGAGDIYKIAENLVEQKNDK